MFELVASFLVLTAGLAYLNHRIIGLPITIGVMMGALLLSLAVIVLDAFGLDGGLRETAGALLKTIDFSDVLLQGMLSVLLFAGALHVDLSELRARRWQVGALALLSTLLSTAAVGLGTWFVLPWLGAPLPLLYCLLFGALISPTDPIAVMGILKTAGAPKELEIVMAGESLFNDGIGVVLFVLLLGVLASGKTPDAAGALELLAVEAGGGVLFGLVLGWATFHLLHSVDNYQVEVLLTLAAVFGGYALANRLHVSGPLAMVVTGLMIGNGGRALAMSDTTRRYIDLFWELMDEILNAVLFVLMGVEVLVVSFSPRSVLAAAAALAITLAARALTVGLPVALLHRRMDLPRGAGVILTWGGLRGGISVALALLLPAGEPRDLVLTLTYCIVVASILGQGLTMAPLVRSFTRPDTGARPAQPPPG